MRAYDHGRGEWPTRSRSSTNKSSHLRAILGLDADLEVAVKEALLGSLSFNGQRCTALKLFMVHEAIAG